MLIGIDGNEANVIQRVGVNEYTFQIIWNLWKLQEKGECKDNLIVYLKEKPLNDLPKERQNFKYKIIPGGGIWIITKLMPNLFFGRPKPDIFFSPSHYTVPFASIPRICSIMDLGYLEFSEQFSKKDFWQLNIWSAISIFVSKGIIAISNSTKDDIVRHYPYAKDKIHVTYLGYDKTKYNSKITSSDVRRVRNRYSIVDDYILYLGTLKPSKNIEGLIEAFSKINPALSNIKLVIAGKKGWLYKAIFDNVEKLGLKEKVIFTDFIPENDKPGLIRGAKAFILPSFWEGFGLDVVSAMACGIPVIVSNVASLPEVIGDAGVLIKPDSTDSIKEGMEKVLLASPSVYNGLVSKGLKEAERFSWENCARETLKILKNER